ncbi:MAG: Uma2 family endonuclease [Chloroflexi bacterium]|nr:Uma2 family endonuclease [Chloroflexota bacterium]
MMGTRTRVSIEAFERFVQQPEHGDRQFELIGGEIVEVVSNNYSSAVAARLLVEIGMAVKRLDAGFVTGADGGYEIGSERYIPDVAYISRQRQPAPSREPYNPTPPDLAVEVLSPSNDDSDMRLKISNYLAASTTVWVVDPERQQVEVHLPGQPGRRYGLDDTLDGGAVLPGLSIPVRDIFPE